MALSTKPKVWKAMIIVVSIITAILMLLLYFKDLFIVGIIGTLLIFTAEKMVKRPKSTGYKKIISITFVLLLFVLLSWLLIKSSFTEIASLMPKTGEQYFNRIIENVKSFAPQYLIRFIQSGIYAKTFENYIIGSLTSAVSNFTTLFAEGILIIPLMFFYYYKQKDRLKRKVLLLIPTKYSKDVKITLFNIKKDLNDFFTAKFLESLVITLICVVGFFFAGLKGWLFMAIIVGVFNIIPYLGPLIGAIPPLMISLLQDPFTVTVVFITIIIAQAVDGIYLIPFMITNKVRMDPLIGIIVTLIGAKLMGPLGMIVAIPVYSVYSKTIKGSYKLFTKIYK